MVLFGALPVSACGSDIRAKTRVESKGGLVADLIVIGYDPPLAEGATSGMLWGRSSACCSSFRSSGLPSVQGSAPSSGRSRRPASTGASVDKITPDKATEALSRLGGRVLKTSLTKDAEEQLQEALHGPEHSQRDRVEPAPAGVS
jgi:hypothetical protein